MGGRNCLSRIPYASSIATILCLVGVGVFCGTLYRGASLANLIFLEVFHIQVRWISVMQMILMIVGGIMAIVGLIIVIMGWLATGSTRHTVYRQWKARAGGKFSHLIFMVIAYLLFYLWTFILVALTMVTLIFYFFWGLCASKQRHPERECIDFVQFDWLFPNNTRIEDMQVCGTDEIKLFCKDYVEIAQISFLIATLATFVITLSIVHYLMCLTSNYAYVRDHGKIADLQEQFLQSESLYKE